MQLGSDGTSSLLAAAHEPVTSRSHEQSSPGGGGFGRGAQKKKKRSKCSALSLYSFGAPSGGAS